MCGKSGCKSNNKKRKRKKRKEKGKFKESCRVCFVERDSRARRRNFLTLLNAIFFLQDQVGQMGRVPNFTPLCTAYFFSSQPLQLTCTKMATVFLLFFLSNFFPFSLFLKFFFLPFHPRVSCLSKGEEICSVYHLFSFLFLSFFPYSFPFSFSLFIRVCLAYRRLHRALSEDISRRKG